MSIFSKIWKGWKRFGQIIGDLIGRLVLSVFYFTKNLEMVRVVISE